MRYGLSPLPSCESAKPVLPHTRLPPGTCHPQRIASPRLHHNSTVWNGQDKIVHKMFVGKGLRASGDRVQSIFRVVSSIHYVQPRQHTLSFACVAGPVDTGEGSSHLASIPGISYLCEPSARPFSVAGPRWLMEPYDQRSVRPGQVCALPRGWIVARKRAVRLESMKCLEHGQEWYY